MLENFLGSQKYLDQQLKKQKDLAPDEAVMFGVAVDREADEGLFVNRPLHKILDDMDQVDCVFFYNPKTGEALKCDEGTFAWLPTDTKRTTLNKLKIALLGDEETGDADDE